MVDPKISVQLISEQKTAENFTALCAQQGLRHNPDSQLALVQAEINGQTQLELRKLVDRRWGGCVVVGGSGVMAHRRKFGGGRAEAVAKAVGVKGDELPSVIDATAGLGRDAFVLASVGCKVRLIERHPVVFLLLQDGLQRAYADTEIGAMLQANLQLLNVKHLSELNPETDFADVVYLDPMYPHKQKSALVKKEMRLFQHLVGGDLDADQLLEPALNLAHKRVVVKRPDYAEFLAQIPPHFSRQTKNHRFDIYSCLANK